VHIVDWANCQGKSAGYKFIAAYDLKLAHPKFLSKQIRHARGGAGWGGLGGGGVVELMQDAFETKFEPMPPWLNSWKGKLDRAPLARIASRHTLDPAS
jgi:hypothetical protein